MPLLLLVLACLACRPADASPLPVVDGVQATVASDTVIVSVAWSPRIDDGRGSIDSIIVNVMNLQQGGWFRTRLGITALSHEVRQPIPFLQATWEVPVQVCYFRRAQVTCADAKTQFDTVDIAPLAPTGITVSARVKP